MNTVSSPVQETEEEKKRRNWLPLLLLLLFLLLATSCIAGFLLGRTSDPGRLGALIDTIVLTPPTPSQPVPSTPATPAVSGTPGPELGRLINLLGVVRYTDGRPFTQGAVRLQSDPRYSDLTEQGRFSFDGVPIGKHRITVLDPDGNELASRDIDVERDAVENSYIEQTATLCIMHIKVLTVEVNIDVTLDEAPGSELDIRLTGTREEEPPAVNPSPAPSAHPSARPSSRPSAEPSATPTIGPSTQPTAGPSSAPSAEPSVTPTVGPSATPTAGPSSTPTAGPSTTPTAGPSSQPTATPSSTPSVEPSATPTTGPSATPTVTPSGEPTVTPTPTARPTPRPTPRPTDSGTTDVYHGETAVTWTQQAVIDLFRSQDGSHPPIAPGSKGYYVFRLRNGRSEPITFTMSLLEENFHIPLEYRIATDELIPKGLTEWQTASLGAPTVSDAVPMAARGEQRFRIEWRWPPDGNDDADTALGRQDDRTYTLKLTIQVEGTV